MGIVAYFWLEDRRGSCSLSMAVTEQNWTEAGELSLDSILLNIEENNTSIEELREYNKNTVVYNLTVGNVHTYFVGNEGVLGHNCDGWDKAVNNLGINSLHYRDKTAYISIATSSEFNIKDIKSVQKAMKAMGANKIEVSTGMIANQELMDAILERYNNNRTFMGGKIERAKSGISDFVIKFIL